MVTIIVVEAIAVGRQLLRGKVFGNEDEIFLAFKLAASENCKDDISSHKESLSVLSFSLSEILLVINFLLNY
jgi:hypothetical protein